MGSELEFAANGPVIVNAAFVAFVDTGCDWTENELMGYPSCMVWIYFVALSAFSSCLLLYSSPSFSASTVYWCPDRKSDQQYSANPGPGCVPLVDKKEKAREEEPSETRQPARDFKIENLQQDVAEFLKKYRRFLECCKTDLAELAEVQALGDEVGELLASTQANISNYSLASRGMMLRDLIPPVAKTRADLRTLRARLEQIGESSNRRDNSDFESAGREAARIRDIEESIDRDIHAPHLPGGPKTGSAIGVAPAAGPSIGKTPTTGVAIGREGTSGQEIGVAPKHSSNIGGTGPTGFAIGGTGRAGPFIGASTLNSDNSSSAGSSLQRSTVGSSISDSSVGSSLRSSTIGSSLQDSSVGSSFGGSSVGSTLQDQSQ